MSCFHGDQLLLPDPEGWWERERGEGEREGEKEGEIDRKRERGRKKKQRTERVRKRGDKKQVCNAEMCCFITHTLPYLTLVTHLEYSHSFHTNT